MEKILCTDRASKHLNCWWPSSSEWDYMPELSRVGVLGMRNRTALRGHMTSTLGAKCHFRGADTPIIVDVTISQFDGGFDEPLPRILIGSLPRYLTVTEPELSDVYNEDQDMEHDDEPISRLLTRHRLK